MDIVIVVVSPTNDPGPVDTVQHGKERCKRVGVRAVVWQTSDSMINAASRLNSSQQPHPFHNTIQIPMLGPPVGPHQPNKPLQNPQQSQQLQQPLPQQQGPQPSEIPLPPQSGQDFTLSNVLHFLQTEWRRYERDRNEWEIERAEMRVSRNFCAGRTRVLTVHCVQQARIALLEGDRRSFDNVKLDLMRRIKMLEYALRMERCVSAVGGRSAQVDVSGDRTKQLGQPSSQAVPIAKLAALQAQSGQASQRDNDSSGSSPRSEGACRLLHCGLGSGLYYIAQRSVPWAQCKLRGPLPKRDGRRLSPVAGSSHTPTRGFECQHIIPPDEERHALS